MPRTVLSPRRSVTAVVAGALLVVAAGCAGTAPSGQDPTTAPAATAPDSTTDPTTAATTVVDLCADGGVPVIQGGQDAAMGTRYVGLTALNCTGSPLELSGFPALQLRDEEGQAIDLEPTPGRVGEPGVDDTSHTVTVAPGGSASVVLSWRNLTEFDAPVTAESVQVTPAAGLPPQTLELHVDLGTTNTFYVTGWALSSPEFAVPTLSTVTGTIPEPADAATG